jgi:hypothetical protein
VPDLAREIAVAEQCSGLILVLRAEHRVLDEDARTRRPERERGVRERGAALERDA